MFQNLKTRVGNMAAALKKYNPLLIELVSRDIKVRYRKSVLGMLWTVLNPLLMMCVITVVFSTIFKQNIPNFPIYYLSGSLIFSFNSEATTNAMHSILSNCSLIKKVYLPKYLFPISCVLSSLVNLGFSLVAMFIVMIVTRTPFHATLLLMPIPIFYTFLFSVGLGTMLAALTVYFQKKLIVLNREVRAQHSKITSSYNEGIMGAKTSKTLALESRLTDEFEQTTANAARAGILHGRMRAIYVPLIVLCGTLAASATLLRGGSMVFKGTLSIGVLSAFMTYALSLFQTFRQQAARISQLISLQANVERVVDLIDEKPTVQDSPEVEAKYGDCFHPKMENWEEMRGEIDFDDVSFTYPDGGEEVLTHFSLHVPAGSTVAIVGETGAGKSTLVNLVCRFFEPTAGRVLIDGRDARERSQLWLHSHVGYVLQSPHLFSGTIRENIRYGKPDATDEEVYAAAKAVSADRVAAKLEQGYDTDVGECGDKLSTGEKQLISFARAVIAKPKIFVLDEATSSVDTETEMLIQKATHTLMQGTTSFVIAHRLSTIRQADVILVIDHGKIVEQGTHESLLKANGAYAGLYHTQLSRQDS